MVGAAITRIISRLLLVASLYCVTARQKHGEMTSGVLSPNYEMDYPDLEQARATPT